MLQPCCGVQTLRWTGNHLFRGNGLGGSCYPKLCTISTDFVGLGWAPETICRLKTPAGTPSSTLSTQRAQPMEPGDPRIQLGGVDLAASQGGGFDFRALDASFFYILLLT
jgi:hypothetical protein